MTDDVKAVVAEMEGAVFEARQSDRPVITLYTDALDTLLSAHRKMVEGLDTAAKYLCRLEGALLADDLDMELNFPDEPSPTAMAESILPGFDSIEYDLSRAAALTGSREQ